MVGGIDLRHVAILSLEILLGDEALHIIDRHWLIDRATRARCLAALVADASAYRWEGILLLDERERIAITPFSRHAQIALHRNMRRTGHLTRSRASLMALDAARILVIGVPIFLAPGKRGQRLLRIRNWAIFGTELLAELHRACGAHFHASRTCHALFAVDLRNIGRPAHVWRVEQLRRTQCIADVHIAIADGEDLIGSIDVGDLVNITIAARQG